MLTRGDARTVYIRQEHPNYFHGDFVMCSVVERSLTMAPNRICMTAGMTPWLALLGSVTPKFGVETL